MGEFVSVSGVIGADRREVLEALHTQVALKRGILEAEPTSIADDDTMVLCSAHGNTTIFFPENDLSWWETSQALSQLLSVPVFAFHIHDGDLWMYELYRNGEKIDAFNPIPDYWIEISDQERRDYQGNARVVCECVPAVAPADISDYFVTWDLNDDKPGKAYPADEHAYGEAWQLLDFMRKLKLPYPLDEEGKPRGPTYQFIIPRPKPGM